MVKVGLDAPPVGNTPLIVFLDESGLSQRPHRCRTWAPRGQTPVLQHHFNWKTLSLIAGLTMWKFYFELFEDSIKGEHVIIFLRHLLRCIEGKLILVWDGLPAHRSKLVKEYLETVGDRVLVERLPAYAPELNPVEYIWA